MTPEKLLSYDLSLFKGMKPADFDGVPIEISEQRLDAGQKVFDQEEMSFDVHFLLSGALLAVFWTDQGREIVFTRFPVGSHFGELTAFDGSTRSLAVIAKTKTTLLVMKRETFLCLFASNAVVRERVTKGLVAKIRDLTARNMERTTMSVQERVRMYLLRLAVEHNKLTAGGLIENAPTHSEIAGSIGANREMVSRSISRLAKNGVIRAARQKIEILDPDALAVSKD